MPQLFLLSFLIKQKKVLLLVIFAPPVCQTADPKYEEAITDPCKPSSGCLGPALREAFRCVQIEIQVDSPACRKFVL